MIFSVFQEIQVFWVFLVHPIVVFQEIQVFWVFLVHPIVVSVLLSASVEIFFVSHLHDFFLSFSITVSKAQNLTRGLYAETFLNHLETNNISFKITSLCLSDKAIINRPGVAGAVL